MTPVSGPAFINETRHRVKKSKKSPEDVELGDRRITENIKTQLTFDSDESKQKTGVRTRTKKVEGKEET